MALTNRVEINIANNAELHANAQHILALTRTVRPKNIFITYNLFLLLLIRYIILRTILHMQPLGYGAIVLYI